MVYEIETVIDTCNLPSRHNEFTEQAINSPNVRLIQNSKEFNGVCFHYALDDDMLYLNNCQEAYKELEQYYDPINIKEAQKGDMISYHELYDINFRYGRINPCKDNVVHFAIIEETKGNLKSIIIKSKWGIDGVFQTNIFDVPDIYGNAIVIWRLNKNKLDKTL